MDLDLSDSVPCSSLAVESVIRTSSAGVIWGSCYGPFDAKRLGLSGSSRASYIIKTVGKSGFSCGLFAAIFSFSHCGMQRYRQRKDWVNTLTAGVIAGTAFGAGTRNWKQVAVYRHFTVAATTHYNATELIELYTMGNPVATTHHSNLCNDDS